METFLVEIDLPTDWTPEYVQLIPAQRQRINELMAVGRISMYALSAERDKLWCALRAKDEYDAMDLLSTFPMIRFMKPKIRSLMFYNGSDEMIPAISLN